MVSRLRRPLQLVAAAIALAVALLALTAAGASARSVTSVSVPADGTYRTTDSLSFTVSFDEAVSVTGTPQLRLDVGSGVVAATYVGGSGTRNLTFVWTVPAGTVDADGIAIDALDLNGGTIRTGASVDADLSLNGVPPTSGILVNAVAPTVVSIVRADAATTNASVVHYTLTFSESVTGLDTADFALSNTGTASGVIASVSGSGTTWTVTVDAVTGDGTLRLDVRGDGSGIFNAAGARVPAYSSGQSYTLDHTGPVITNVNGLLNGTYSAGANLSFNVFFNEDIHVTGTPRVALDIGGVTRYADFSSTVGSNVLVFRTTVVSGDSDSDGITIGALQLNGGTITDNAGNAAGLTLNSVQSTSGVRVDAVAPSVVSITRASASPTNAGSVAYTVTFSEPVTGVDISDFSLLSWGPAAGSVVAVSGSGTTYTVTVAGISGTGELRLDVPAGATIFDSASNRVGGYSAGERYVVDRDAPVVAAVGVPSDSTYRRGQNLDFSVRFDGPVQVTGTGHRLALDVGGTTAYASYVNGSGTDTVTFRWTVPAAASDTDGIQINALQLYGGTIRDAAGNDAVLTLNGVAATGGVRVDGIAPTLVSITRADTSPTNATSVRYTVTFSEPVTGVDAGDFAVGSTGTVTGSISSVTGSGATYTVVVGSLAGAGTLGLQVAGAADIRDTAGNPLSGSTTGETYTVDRVAPTGTLAVAPGQPSADSVAFRLSFSEPISGLEARDLVLGGTAAPARATLSGSGQTYEIVVTGMSRAGTVSVALPTGAAFDATGNPNVAVAAVSASWTPPAAPAPGWTPAPTLPEAPQPSEPVTDETEAGADASASPAAPALFAAGLTSGTTCVRPTAAGMRGLRVAYTLRQAATVTFTLQRRANTSRAARSCPRAAGEPSLTPGAAGVYRTVSRPSSGARAAKARPARLVQRLRAGRHTLRLSDLLGRGTLAPGTYRITVTAVDADGHTTVGEPYKFWVLAAKR